jgi:circadian clock protein KaiB
MTRRQSRSIEVESMRSMTLAHASAHYLMRLYVLGSTPNSVRAIANIRKICELHLCGRYDLEVVDIAQRPEWVTIDQIIAAPTLIKMSPAPVRRFIGDLSQTRPIMIGLDLWPMPATAAAATTG